MTVLVLIMNYVYIFSNQLDGGLQLKTEFGLSWT